MKQTRVTLALVWMTALTSSALADAPPGRYVANADTVLDRRTKLTWQRTSDRVGRTRDDAVTYCQQLTLDGGGWRLPTIRELLTILDRSAIGGLDPVAFANDIGYVYWSSTPSTKDPLLGWLADFGVGVTVPNDITFPSFVRCVR